MGLTILPMSLRHHLCIGCAIAGMIANPNLAIPGFAMAGLDLSVDQASLAKACVLERTPYWGLALSERHAWKVEVVLTDFVLSEMKKEGSSHYRPECVAEPRTEETKAPTPKPGPKKRPKTPKTGQQAGASEGTGEGEGEEPAPKKPRKTTKDKNEDEGGGEKSDASSLPW
jgi:hypothetical protein